jgi:hypothetical protein
VLGVVICAQGIGVRIGLGVVICAQEIGDRLCSREVTGCGKSGDMCSE